MLNNRYALGERLYTGHLGSIYRARDMGMPNLPCKHPNVLIHLCPKQTITYSALPQVLEKLQHRINTQAFPSILPLLDAGWHKDQAYFVVPCPDSWVLNILPHSEKPTQPHLKAAELIAALQQADFLKEGVEPTLFMVLPDGQPYLLGTALAEEIQKLQHPNLVLNPAYSSSISNKPTSLRQLGLWLTGIVLTSAAAAGGIHYYRQSTLHTVPPSQIPHPVSAANPMPTTTAALDNAETATSTRLETPPLEKPTTLTSVTTVEPPSLPIESPAFKQQLQKAQTSLDNQHLQTALYYLRQIEQPQRQHPKTIELALQIRQAAEQLAQQKTTNAPAEAEALQVLAQDIAKEFKLTPTTQP